MKIVSRRARRERREEGAQDAIRPETAKASAMGFLLVESYVDG